MLPIGNPSRYGLVFYVFGVERSSGCRVGILQVVSLEVLSAYSGNNKGRQEDVVDRIKRRFNKDGMRRAETY